jgi:serine protease Do
MNGQPLVSVADAQWVLQQSGDSGQIALEVQRGNQTVGLTLDLPKGWRRTADISWRVTTWDLRRMAFGGMVLEPMTDAERAELNLPADKLALRVKHVGQYGEHARAKQAGFVKGDIVVSFDGRTQPQTESELLAYGMQQKRTGDKIEIGVLRDGVKKTFTVALQ